MKKVIILSIVILCGISNSFAQEENKKDRGNKDFSEILPHGGDFALGMDVVNLVKTINNSITNANSGNSVVAFRSDFFGKYFLNTRNALRFRLGIGLNNSTNRAFVRDDAANLLNPITNDPLLEIKTVDVRKLRNTTLELGIGYEYRRSLWRVQGYVGAEIFGGTILHKNTFEYGNPMTETNQQPTFDPLTDLNNPLPNLLGYRPLQSKGGNTLTAGAALFVGADIFLCRNLSIGAEFNLEGRYNRTGELNMLTETWILQQAYKAKEAIIPVTSSFRLLPIGRLNLSIYF
ncbi:MAG: hypothetical protein LBQ64_01380 [Bacteroidales bacterium]|jgi:hypothetical protein|nr:hypothetical protein [Bacteroidales bacterium]